MADKPRFSVTIPAYNAQATLSHTVESVRAQTFSDWEVVIVDDGSTDETLAVARRLVDDDRIRVVSQENRGSGGAYNTAVTAARSDLLVMLSSDDLLLPEHLATFDAAIRSHPAASVFTSGGWYEYDDGHREAARPQAHWADPAECTLEELLQACFYGVGAVYRRAVHAAVGGFRERIYAEDYLFWLLALAHGFRHHHIDAPLSIHRRTALQKSANAIAMRETDLRVITEVVGTGLLSPTQMTAARRSAARIRRVIRARRSLARAVGPERLERLVARAHTIHTGAQAGPTRGASAVAVTFINNFAGPTLGGGEVQLLALLRGLTAAGVRPSVLCAAGSALERETHALPGVQVLPVDFALCSLPALIANSSAQLEGASVVQGTGFLTNVIARAVGTRAHMPVVNTVHVLPGAARLDGESRAFGVLRATLDLPSRRCVARYVAVSAAVRSALVADRIDAQRISVIPNGIDPVELRRAASSDRSPALRPAGAYVGFIGRLERVKGAEFFVRGAALVAADHPDVRFVVVGSGSTEGELRELAADVGVAAAVEFLGYVDSVPPVLASLDVVVVPSLSEASGLTAMEALALGVPVVASRVGGLPDVVIDGHTGLLVPPADPVAIARAVSRLLDGPDLSRRLVAAGMQHVEESYSVDRMVQAYLNMYERLLPARTCHT